MDMLWHISCISVLLANHSQYIRNLLVYVYLFIISFNSQDYGKKKKTDDILRWITDKHFKKSIDRDMRWGDKAAETGNNGEPLP